MTCKICGIQCVGETGNLFSNRNTQHKSAMKCGKTTSLIYQHFHSYPDGTRRNNFDDFIVQPIEVFADICGYYSE